MSVNIFPLKSISFKKGAKKSQLHEIVRKFANVFTNTIFIAKMPFKDGF